MSEINRLSSNAPWVEFSINNDDWKNADPKVLKTLLVHTHLIRIFEEAVVQLAMEGLVHGPAHSSVGQEGGAAGSLAYLKPYDQINGSHRGHHQFLSKALAYLRPNGIDPTADISSDIYELIQRALAEILGLAQGFCKGRGGSMHLRWDKAGVLGTNAIVGGGIPLAAGAAWAHKHAKTDAIAVTYFGDGAVNIGSALETMNLAAAWKLPLCFFIENNKYAVSTSVEEATAEPRLSARGQAFNIPSWKVDGMNPLAVHLAMQEAVEHMRAGNGPTIIEADLYRFYHQNGGFPGSAFGYRSKEEEQQWRERDPITLMNTKVIELGILDQPQIDAMVNNINECVAIAINNLIEADPDGKKGKRRIKPELWPAPSFRDVGLRSDLSEIADLKTTEQESYNGSMKTVKFIDAVADVMQRRMQTDAGVVILGEDVHRLKGGTNGATRGLSQEFPDRTLGTPISENAFAGLGGGLAMDGRYRPVIEFMYPDFMWVAADQVFNQIGKARHMFGGDINMPLILRSKVAIGSGYGSQHSMDPAGIFATSPGWRIVAASTPFDYVGLMNTAMRIQDPVLVIEHIDLYASSGEIPENDLDFNIAFGKQALVPKLLPKKMVIIGAGVIGIEFASIYKTLGSEVHIIESADKILANQDNDVITHITKALKDDGINIHTKAKIKQAQQNHDTTWDIDLFDQKITNADVVLVAIGVSGNSDNIGLENTNVVIKNSFIETNQYCATAQANIYAIGDVAGAPCLAHKASREAIICVEHIADLNPQPINKNDIPACVYSHPQIASIGLTETAAKELGYEVNIGNFPTMANGKALAMGYKDGFTKIIFDKKTGELLGAHMVGSDVPELIQGFGIAKNLETTEQDLMNTIFAHPTLSETMHESVLSAYKKAIHY